MKSKTKDVLVTAYCFVAIGLFSLGLGIKIATIATEHVDETTTAKPIYQQRIGDDTEPDILIIYEAEVDGVKVYPGVIKEAE